jgi:hypothetical protein
VPTYDVNDAGDALDTHVHAFFAGHAVTRRQWPLGPVEQRIPGFFVYAAGPGPRFAGWTYLTAGCWKATARHQHDLEFVLSTNTDDVRHVELLTMLAYYHAGQESQRLEICAWNNGHARILATQPITSAEHKLKVAHGLEALEQRLEATAADFANPHRPSVA